MAICIPKGQHILFQMHYTPNGHATEDRSCIGFCFADEKDVTQLLTSRMVRNGRFEIPSNADAHEVTAEYYVAADERLVSMTPHMHLRGDKFRYEAVYPSGDREILLDVPSYDFNWQQKFVLAEPKLLPRGTRIVCTGTYDNSENNLVNPDPNQIVRWGDQSYEEMMIGFFSTLPVAKNEAVTLKSTDVRIDPSGKWSWQKIGRMPRGSVVLTLRDSRLTGTASTRGVKRPIENAVITGVQLEFTVSVPDFGMMLEFKGKINRGNIIGTMTQFRLRAGEKLGPLPWKALRAR